MTEIEQQLQDEIIGLQIELVEQEKHIKNLSSVVLKMQQDMVELRIELKQMKEKIISSSEGEQFNLEEEKPPHY